MEAHPDVFGGGVETTLEPSIVEPTSNEDTLAWDEGCTDRNHTPERDPQESEAGRASGTNEADRGEHVVGADSGPGRNAIESGNADRGIDSGATDHVLYRQNLAPGDEPKWPHNGETEVGQVLTEKESGVVGSKDIVGDTCVGDGYNLLTSMRNSATEATGDLLDNDTDLELHRHSHLQHSAEMQNARDVLAGKLDAMNVSIREVDGSMDESEVA